MPPEAGSLEDSEECNAQSSRVSPMLTHGVILGRPPGWGVVTIVKEPGTSPPFCTVPTVG